MSSKVYFMDDHAGSTSESTPFKAVKVLRDAGLETVFKKGDKVGIKVHFGEFGNSLNLRPHWVSAIVEEVKRLGGEPVVFDCNTAPLGFNASRSIKSDHLRTAAVHGFTEETMGCPVWICDGEYGEDEVEVKVPHGVYLKNTYMGKQILEFDAIVVVTHFKGHPMGVFGGSLKNVGIGMGSPKGKLATHFVLHPTLGLKSWTINQDAAKQAAGAAHPNLIDNMVASCPQEAFEWKNETFNFMPEKCKLCGHCMAFMLTGVFNLHPDLISSWAPAIVDAAAGYINAIGKDKMIYLNYAFDISPWCDCCAFHDRALIPNIGVFASKDPVAVDMASVEATEAVAANPGSTADQFGFSEPNTERFTNCSSMAKKSQWAQLNAGVYNGIGSTDYVLVKSEPAPEGEFWFPPYTPVNIFPVVHKETFKKVDNTVGEFFYETPNVSEEKLSIKPSGKIEEITIEEEKAEAGLA